MIAAHLLSLAIFASGAVAAPAVRSVPTQVSSGTIDAAWTLASPNLIKDLIQNGQRVLVGTQGSREPMTPGFCVSECQTRGFALAGLEHMSECFCGNALTNGASLLTIADTPFMACNGNPDLTCGGDGALQLYRSRLLTDKDLNLQLPAGWVSASPKIITDLIQPSPNTRIMFTRSGVSGTNTIGKCVSYCNSKNWSLAGMEHGSECFCGDFLQNGGSLSNTKNKPYMDCEGDASQICGGDGGLTLYRNSANLDATLKPIGGKPLAVVSSASIASVSAISTASVATAAATSIASVASVSAQSTASVASTISVAKAAATPIANPSGLSLGNGFTTTGTCVAEVDGRLLNGASTASSTMNYGECTDFCFQRGFKAAAVEYGSECRCGDVPASTSPSTQCTMDCSGAPGVNCGGPNAMILFTTTASKSVSALPAGWSNSGICAAEVDGRLLSGASFAGNDNSPSVCAAKCGAAGFSTAGVEYGSECWCGNIADVSTLATSGSCNMACAGESAARCGGPGALNIYTYSAPTTLAP